MIDTETVWEIDYCEIDSMGRYMKTAFIAENKLTDAILLLNAICEQSNQKVEIIKAISHYGAYIVNK